MWPSLPTPYRSLTRNSRFGLPANLLNVITGPFFFFFYDGPDPGNVFAEFDAIPFIDDDTKERDYYSLSQEAGGAALSGFGNSFRVTTVPNLPEPQMVDFFEDMWNRTYAQSLDDSLTNLDVQILGMDPQPVSVRIAQASQAQGGNALGLDPNHGDRVWIENDFLWLNPACDEKCPQISDELSSGLLANQKAVFKGVPPTNYKSGDIDTIR